MPTKAATTIALSSLLYSTTHALVPLHNIHPPVDDKNLQPTPSELDPAHWAPIASFAPITTTTSIPTPTPATSVQELEYHILPLGLDAAVPELRVRQVTGQAGGATLTAAGQVSPVTTYLANEEVAPGSFAQVPVVYTQSFVLIPDQWPSAVAGTIGLGTIPGTVGQVRSKRSEPTQAPMAEVSVLGENNYFSIAPTPSQTLELGLENDARRAFQAGSLALLAVGMAIMCLSYL